ncbi:MAG: DivIVA domain-containing protein, partial [Desulfocapsa sp.]
MTITPQLIKDQEFESKFRGFDPIEVRDYLETI